MKTEAGIVLAGSDGADDGDVGVVGFLGDLFGFVDEACAEANVLGFAFAFCADGEGGAVYVYFSYHGVVGEFWQGMGVMGIGEGKA